MPSSTCTTATCQCTAVISSPKAEVENFCPLQLARCINSSDYAWFCLAILKPLSFVLIPNRKQSRARAIYYLCSHLYPTLFLRGTNENIFLFLLPCLATLPFSAWLLNDLLHYLSNVVFYVVQSLFFPLFLSVSAYSQISTVVKTCIQLAQSGVLPHMLHPHHLIQTLQIQIPNCSHTCDFRSHLAPYTANPWGIHSS